MNPQWWSDLTLSDAQQGFALLSAFTDENADPPPNSDQVARAFCIKVLLEGEAAAREFVSTLEGINKTKIGLISTDPSAPEHERWGLKIGTMATALKESLPLLPERFRETVGELRDTLIFEYQKFIGRLHMHQLRARFWRPDSGNP